MKVWGKERLKVLASEFTNIIAVFLHVSYARALRLLSFTQVGKKKNIPGKIKYGIWL